MYDWDQLNLKLDMICIEYLEIDLYLSKFYFICANLLAFFTFTVKKPIL